MNDGLQRGRVRVGAGSIDLTTGRDDTYLERLTEPVGLGMDFDLMTLTSFLVHPDDTVLDVGANIGFFGLACLSLMGTGTVHSFEPSPTTFEHLCRNVELNGRGGQLHPHNYGLSDEDATITMATPPIGLSAGHVIVDGGVILDKDHLETIEVKRLDNLHLVERCDLLKVDIEGHEPQFLRGAQGTIDRLAPACVMEVNHWCLDALNLTPMPTFVDQVLDMFPLVYGFDMADIIDVRDDRIGFMHGNMVESRYQNVYCDFDRARGAEVVARYQRFLKDGHREAVAAARAEADVANARAEAAAANARAEAEAAARHELSEIRSESAAAAARADVASAALHELSQTRTVRAARRINQFIGRS